MEEDREEPPPAEKASSSSSSGEKKGSPCEECGEQPWKYRCPGCARLTCSLPCVQAHKRRTACTGKRARTDPVPLAQFDDNQLISGKPAPNPSPRFSFASFVPLIIINRCRPLIELLPCACA